MYATKLPKLALRSAAKGLLARWQRVLIWLIAL
jgi:hypothetical protein